MSKIPISELENAFAEYDEELLETTINSALEQGLDALAILNHLSGLLEDIGERFSKGELFLPDMVMAGELMDASMALLKPAIMKNDAYLPTGKKILLGTVKGDVHDIGKNMLKMMWVASGYEVFDLGVDVPAETFYNKSQEVQPDIVALSSCMTTTVPSMKDTIELFKSKGLDEKYKIIVGGGSVNSQLAESLGAYAYGGDDAYQAVKVLKEIFASEEIPSVS